MIDPPCPELLDRVIAVDAASDLPLHAQVRRALKTLIERHFQDGQKFFTEPELIQRLRVSQGTVRRALADLSREGLLERRVAKGSFVRKPAAGRPSERRLGVFAPAWDNAFWAALLEQLSLACRDLDCRMQIYHTQQGRKVAEAYGRVEGPPQEEGIILLGSVAGESAHLYELLSERGYRVVAVDVPVPGPDRAFVGVDNREGIRIGLEHLLGLGHRRVALLVDEPAAEPAVMERREAFTTVLSQRGLEALVIDCGTRSWDSPFDMAYARMPQVMAAEPTAIFAVSDPGAWAALKWLAEQHIEVPRQVSVLGFDDDQPSRFTQPALSTIAQPLQAIARSALQMLWENPEGPTRRLLPPALVIRRSTAPPPGDLGHGHPASD